MHKCQKREGTERAGVLHVLIRGNHSPSTFLSFLTNDCPLVYQGHDKHNTLRRMGGGLGKENNLLTLEKLHNKYDMALKMSIKITI